MTALLRRLLPLLALCAVLLTPAVAQADSIAIVRDCQDGRLDGSYSRVELDRALADIPTDVDEYTDCRTVIGRSVLGDGSGGGLGGPGDAALGGPDDSIPLPSSNGQTAEQLVAAASPQERVQLASAIAQADDRTVQLGGDAVSPDASSFSPDGDGNTIPTSVVLVLVALLAGAVGAVSQGAVRRRRRRDGTGLPS